MRRRDSSCSGAEERREQEVWRANFFVLSRVSFNQVLSRARNLEYLSLRSCWARSEATRKG